MEYSKQTFRQQIMALLEHQKASTHELSTIVGLPERQVEDHLSHIVKTIARAQTKTFLLHPAMCRDCRFIFHARTRLTRPSRCPRCKGENIGAPRYEIVKTKTCRSGKEEQGIKC